MKLWTKKDAEVADFTLDWSSDLGDDVIATSVWSDIDPGIDTDDKADTHEATTTTIWISGGTVGEVYSLTNTVTTEGGRTFVQQAAVRVVPTATVLPGFSGCPWPVDAACAKDLWETYDEETRQRAVSYASATLSRLTAYRVGDCPVTVLPALQNGCCVPVSGPLDPSMGLNYTVGAYGMYGTWALGRCSNPKELLLPQPVYRVDEVSIEGIVMDPADYSLQRGRLGVGLMYTGTERDAWPTSEVWSVTYLNTAPVDAEGAHAAGLLAMEFAKACSGTGKCKFPSNISSVVRSGVAIEFITGAFPDGMTGIREVDNYTAKWTRRGRPAATLYDPGAPDHRVVL